MQKLFYEVSSLDRRCYEELALTEDLLMEHASLSIYSYIEKNFSKLKDILIVCGPGNNGADGIALARLLYKKFNVKLFIPFGAKSQMAKIQLKRAELLGIEQINFICNCDIVVDCLFGSGLNKALDENSINLINKMNYLDAVKVACDIPSGINSFGQILNTAFKADVTITMGALKVALYSDIAKDFVGKISVANLGIQREVYEKESDIYLLEKEDMRLPFRVEKNSHKGTFGHVSIIIGDKTGAGKIACEAAFKFGAGLVTAVSHKILNVPYNIMQSHFIPTNTTSVAIGMGLGNFENDEIKNILSLEIPKIIDADLFYETIILETLDKKVVLTPHPKEFCSLLKLCGICDINIETLQNDRFKYAKLFSEKYPNVTLLLKGANTIIAYKSKIYVNSFGTPSLSKGGSGDVLSGLIAGLLAQGYSCLESAITASLAHAFAAKEFSKNSYALTPQDIIEEITKL